MAKKTPTGIEFMMSKKGIIENIRFCGSGDNTDRTNLLCILIASMHETKDKGLSGEDYVMAVTKCMDNYIKRLCSQSKTKRNKEHRDTHDLKEALAYASKRKEYYDARNNMLEAHDNLLMARKAVEESQAILKKAEDADAASRRFYKDVLKKYTNS